MEGEVSHHHKRDDNNGQEHHHHALALEARGKEALLGGQYIFLRARNARERGLAGEEKYVTSGRAFLKR